MRPSPRRHTQFGKYLPAPTITSVSNVSNGVQVNCNSSCEDDIVFYYKTEGGEWTKAGSKTWGEPYWEGTFTVKGLTSGTKYYFSARLKDRDGVYSAYSDSKSIKYVAAPKLPTAENTSTGVKLTWTAVPGAAKYRVYYRTETGDWKKAADTSKTSYTVKDLKAGKKYYFTICCLNSEGSKVSAYNTTGKGLTVK